ncbi:splicing regulator SDE2 [Periplaneta americana]|uniref:splicing regulator SDE2 n=1 Tax=Periplaneta americana TaxID=6978 RepID=UPI0037E89ECA
MLFISCQFLRDAKIEKSPILASDVKRIVRSGEVFGENDIYLLYNGKKLSDDAILTSGIVHIVPRLPGGKGGFGSMLRAIGAQIEKTTNREACRDLSGRRLRDINEEKRLKNWIAQQAEREREAAERKRRKLERLKQEPRHNFQDHTYEEERSQLTEKVSDAVEQGFRIASSSNGAPGCSQKRKATSTATTSAKKKTCLWLGVDEDLDSENDSDSSEDGDGTSMEKSSKEKKTITTEVSEDSSVSSSCTSNGNKNNIDEKPDKVTLKTPESTNSSTVATNI